MPTDEASGFVIKRSSCPTPGGVLRTAGAGNRRKAGRVTHSRRTTNRIKGFPLTVKDENRTAPIPPAAKKVLITLEILPRKIYNNPTNAGVAQW